MTEAQMPKFKVVRELTLPDCIMKCLTCQYEFCVDPCTEENVTRVIVEGRIRLVTQCPKCGIKATEGDGTKRGETGEGAPDNG